MKEFWQYHPALLIALLLILFLSIVQLPQKEGEIRGISRDWKGKIVFSGANGKYKPTEEELELLEKGRWITPLTRFIWKEKIKESFKERFGEKGAGDLVASLLIGTPLPSHLKSLFQKTGLLHLVAISGFHFTLLRSFLFALLGFLFRGRKRLIVLLLFLGCYAFLLGGVPSVLRAFFASLVALFCTLFDRQCKPLNTFGISLIMTLVFDPSLMFQLSFQMSFGITFAILTLYPVMKSAIRMPTLEEVKVEKWPMQLFLSIRTLFEKSMIFLLSVSVMVFPLSLYAFGSFPIFSLLINLLFTPLFSLLAAGVIVATLLPPLDPLMTIFGELLIFLLSLFETTELPMVEGTTSPFIIICILGFLLLLSMSKETKKSNGLYDLLM
jgi:competence protein ComEC